MAKVITGTKSHRQQVSLKKGSGSTDPRQTRCTSCKQGLAVQVHDGKGGFVYRCGMCHAMFAFTKI